MSSRVQLLTSSGLRLDSRLPLELRSIKFNIITDSTTNTADGYATATHGLTTITSSVYGPREPSRTGPFSTSANNISATAKDKAQVNVQVGIAGWSEKNVNSNTTTGTIRRGGRDRKAIELASAIKATFEPVILLHLYPRSAIDIYIQIYQVDGSMLQAAINATTLALISAGIPLSDYIVSLSLASYPSLPPLLAVPTLPFTLLAPSVPNSNSTTTSSGSGSTTLLDCCAAEESALPGLTIAVLPRSRKISLVSLETRMGVGRFEEMMRWGVEAGKVLQGAMEEAVKEWAQNVKEPSSHLINLFPGIKGAKTGEGKPEEDGDGMEE